MPDNAFGGRQARRLLAILASRRGQVVNRDSLIDFLWDESVPADPGANLNAIVGRLRRALGTSDLVHTTPNGYSLVNHDRCVVDIERFERHVEHGLDLLRNHHIREAALLLSGAVDAWDEPFGEERYSDWAAGPIRWLERLYTDALEGAARAASADGDPTEAIRHAQEAVSREPLRESAAVSLARAQARAGDRAGALETLDSLRRVLDSELGLRPSAEAAAAREAILEDEIGTPGTIPGSGGLIHPTTQLVGRERELDELGGLVERGRLVTVTGPGGVGKTRLAIEAVRRLSSEIAVVMCSLDHVDHPGVVSHAVAHSADVLVSPDRTAVGDIAAAFQDRKTLLFLDGCDTTVRRVADLAATLLARCPLLTVLVTSRERCGLPGEFVLRLGPLDLGDGCAAVQLFIQRATETDPSFRTDRDAMDMVEEICQRLDGMPLALELAAAHLSSMSLRDLLRRLEPLPLGRSEPLLAVVDSSYRLLDEPDRQVLERLAVFPSDFNLDAAEAVAASGQPRPIARLVDKSLVSRVGPERYRLLAATRIYAGRRLEEREQTPVARTLHARHYLGLAEAAADGFMTSEEARWMRIIGAEMDNMRSVQHQAIERTSTEEALTLATSLTHYAQWHVATEPFDWAAEAVNLEGASDHWLHPAALGAVALAETNRGELDQAVSLARQALAHEGPSFVKLTPIRALCLAALYRREVEECHRLGAQLETMAAQSEMQFFVVDSLLIRASVDVLTRQPGAKSQVRHALTASERLGVPSLIAFGNELMGEAVHDARPEEALNAFQRAQEIADGVSCRLVSGLALLGAGSTLMKLGRREESRQRLRQSALYWRKAGNVTLQWTTLRYVAELLSRFDQTDLTRRILAAADSDNRAPPVASAQAERLANLQSRLGDPDHPPETLDEIGQEAVRALERLGQRLEL